MNKFLDQKKREQIYLLNGELIAHIFKLKTPTNAKIEHVGEGNMFNITFLSNGDILHCNGRIEQDEEKACCDRDEEVLKKMDV